MNPDDISFICLNSGSAHNGKAQWQEIVPQSFNLCQRAVFLRRILVLFVFPNGGGVIESVLLLWLVQERRKVGHE